MAGSTGLQGDESREEVRGEQGTIEDVVAGIRERPLILSEGDIERAVCFQDIPCAFGQVVEDHVRRVINSFPGLRSIDSSHGVFSQANGGKRSRRRWISKEVDGKVLSCRASNYVKNAPEIGRVWHHPTKPRKWAFTPVCEIDVLYESPSEYRFGEVKCIFSEVLQNIDDQMKQLLNMTSMVRKWLPRFLGPDKPLEGMLFVNKEFLENADLGRYRSSCWDDSWTAYQSELERQSVSVVTLNVGLQDYFSYCKRVIEVCPSAVSSIEMKSLRVRLDRYVDRMK